MKRAAGKWGTWEGEPEEGEVGNKSPGTKENQPVTLKGGGGHGGNFVERGRI